LVQTSVRVGLGSAQPKITKVMFF